MIGFGCLFTISGYRTTKPNGVPAFDIRSHRPEYENIVPDELIRRIIASPKAQEAVASILQKWEKLKGNLTAFTIFLKSIKVDTNIIGALKTWSMIQTPVESKNSFLEFLLQPAYNHHFSALLGKEGMEALNNEIDLRGYLHEVGVLCRLLKAHRVGSQDKGSDVDLMCHVNQMGEQLDPENQEKLEEENGTNMDLTLFTLSHDYHSVSWASKGHPLVVQFLLSCNGIMSQLSPEQMEELLQIRIKGFWALFTKWDLIPFLIQLGKSEEEAKAILSRAQDGTLMCEDMVALVKAFRQGRVTIPTEQRILDKWLKAINSLLKQYLHITALVNGHYTAVKEELIAQSAITGNVGTFLEYVLYHGNQGALEQQGVTDLLHLLLTDAPLFTPGLTLQQGPMWMVRLADYARRMSMSNSTAVQRQGQEQTSVPLTADVFRLLLTKQPSHPVVNWFITQIKMVKEKHDKRDKKTHLSLFETSLMSIAKKIGPETTDATLVSMLVTMPSNDLSKIVPKDADVLKSIPPISREEYEQMIGMLMTVDGVSALCITYGDVGMSLDNDRCIAIFIDPENADTYIVKTSSGIYAPRPLSSSITQGGDVSTLILQEKGGKLFPVEIRNFYLDEKGERVYVTEYKGKVVHLDGTPVPPTTTLQYELVPATEAPLLERYAILSKTGIMDKNFRERLSLEPLFYTPEINKGKWRDFIHYIIRWMSDTLTELSVLLHMLRTIKAPQSLIARIEAMKKTRDELFEAMKQPNAINQEFMQKWVSMLHEMFALGLHTPDVLAFMQRHRDINGLTEEQTLKIQRTLQAMYMSRLSFFKAIVFRLCQILYGLFVCIPENQRMIYVKAELAEKVLPVLHEKKIQMSIDTLVALLHRNFSLPNDIRLTSSLHMDFEKFVLGALAVLFPHFTGQELRQMEKGEQMSWLLVTPISDAVQEPLPALVPEHLVASASIPIQEAPTLEELQLFVQKAKDRSAGKPWLKTIDKFAELYELGRIDECLKAILMKIADCNDILKAIVIVAKKVCGQSQAHRIEALIVLGLVNYFGHGQEAFIASIKVEKGAYDATNDIKELPKRIAELHNSSQASAPAPASPHTSFFSRNRGDVYKTIGEYKRGLNIIAVYDSEKMVFIVVEEKDELHVTQLSETTLVIISYTNPALSFELLSSMKQKETTSEFELFSDTIPSTSQVPLVLATTQDQTCPVPTKKLLITELNAEVLTELQKHGIDFLGFLPFGSLLVHTDETRPMGKDADFRVIIPTGKREGYTFNASDGTECDLSFTTLANAEKEHEVIIAMLLGSQILDASGQMTKLIALPPTLSEALKLLLPLVGTTIHYNGLKGGNDPVKTFQSVKLMVVLMTMVAKQQQFPSYDPHTFFPEGFNKDAIVQFLTTSNVECKMVMDVFTKAQYTVDKSGALKAQELRYTPILAALPQSLKEPLVAFKRITPKTGVSGVRIALDLISKQ